MAEKEGTDTRTNDFSPHIEVAQVLKLNRDFVFGPFEPFSRLSPIPSMSALLAQYRARIFIRLWTHRCSVKGPRS